MDYQDERKVDCEVTACYNCVNHNACNYEYEEQQKQDEKCEKCTKEISAECVVDGCEFEPKQGEKNCRNCGQPRDYKNRCIPFIEGKCIEVHTGWIPKQNDATDRSIKVGDEVRVKGSDPVTDDCDYGVCTRSLPNVNTIYVMRRDGSSSKENKDEWYRTGKFFPQIAEVLEQLRGEI